MKFNFYPYFDTPGDTGIGVIKAPLGGKDEKNSDDVDLINKVLADKDEKPIKEDKEEVLDDEPEDENKENLIDENDEVLDDEAPADDLLVESNRGLDLKKIKEKYPDFAKTNEFKELRNAYHRESKYTELFPTIEDAQEAAENNETFNKLNEALVGNGDSLPLLNGLKEANPESLKKVALSFLDNVAKVDTQLFTEVVNPIVRRLARQIHNEGKKILSRNAESDDGKALLATARNIMQYVFEDADQIDKDEPKPDNKVSEERKKIDEERQQIRMDKFQNAFQVASSSVERNLDKQILEGLDPDGKFNEFTRDTLLEKIKNSVKSQIDKDQVHVRRMNSLWKRAEAEGYNRDSLSRIVSAYLERARPIIPTERTKYRSIAIKGKAPENTEDKDRELKLASRGRSSRAPETRVNIRAVDPKKIDYRQTSDDDIFSGKIKLKG